MTFENLQLKVNLMAVSANDALIKFGKILYDSNKRIGYSSMYIPVKRGEHEIDFHIHKWSDNRTFGLTIEYREIVDRYKRELIDIDQYSLPSLTMVWIVIKSTIKAFTI